MFSAYSLRVGTSNFGCQESSGTGSRSSLNPNRGAEKVSHRGRTSGAGSVLYLMGTASWGRMEKKRKWIAAMFPPTKRGSQRCSHPPGVDLGTVIGHLRTHPLSAPKPGTGGDTPPDAPLRGQGPRPCAAWAGERRRRRTGWRLSAG